MVGLSWVHALEQGADFVFLSAVEVDVVKTESPLSYEDAEMELDEIFDQINPDEEEDDNE